ncbi:MAG: hypothetical protein KDD69_00150 [Bdellovibrionales bacterium]|nr:hypothetical protein [Bdellovibrionales bacterium]
MASENELIRRKKRRCFDEWMAGDHVLIQLDARRADVEVPAHLKDNPALTLKLSYRFQGEVTQDDDKVTAYLKFGGEYYCCVVPWDAVWGMTAGDGNSQVWPEHVPREVMTQLARAKLSEIGSKLLGKVRPLARPAEKPSPTSASTASTEPEKPKGAEADDKKRGAHLRRIK